MSTFGVQVQGAYDGVAASGASGNYYIQGGDFPGGNITDVVAQVENRAGNAAFNDWDFAIYSGGDSNGPNGATKVWQSKYYAGVNLGSIGASPSSHWVSLVDAGGAAPNINVSAGYIWFVFRSADGLQGAFVNQGTTAGDISTYGRKVRTGASAPNNSWPSTFPGNHNSSTYIEIYKFYVTITPPADTTPPSAPGTPATSRLTSTTASVSYSAATDDTAVTGYESSLDNSSWTDRGNNTSFTQTGLTPSTGATIYVRAYDAAGNHGSASSAAIAADPAPDVTDVDTDEIISFGQTGVVVTGTNMGGNTAARTITIEQGAVSVTQTQTAGDASSGTFNVVQGNLKTGSATLKVTRVGDSSYDTIAITLASASDRLNVDVVSPAATAANRLTATPDIATGDQVEVYNIVGGVPADITLSANLTFNLDSDITSFYFRVWSSGEWGTGTQQTFSSPVPNPDVTPPSVTGMPAVSLITASGARVTYAAATDNVGVAGYEYSIDLAVTWVDAGNVLTFDLSGLDAATDYTVMVRAYDASGNKGTARSALFTTLSGADSTPPSQPGALSFSSTTAISTQVTWTAATDDVAVAGYQISLDNSTWTTLGNVLTATLSGLSAGTAYTVYVRAYDTSLNYGSARSGNVTTPADPAASGPIGQAPRKQRKLFRFF